MKGGFLAAGLFSFWQPGPALSPVATTAELSANPVLVWSVALPGNPANTATRAEPGGVGVVGDRLYVGYSGADALLVLDRHDGRLVGRLPTHGPVAATPVVEGGFVYTVDRAGYTSAWKLVPDRPTGVAEVPAWSHYSGSPITSPPAVVNGVVYVANLDDQVYALDGASGSVLWRHVHPLDAGRGGSLELMGAPSPVVRGDVVYAGFSDGFVAALSTRDGDPGWTTGVGEGTYPDVIAPSAAVGDALVVGGFTGPLLSVDVATRAPRWRIEAGSSSPFLLKGDTLWQGGTDGKLRRIDARTGDVAWAWDSLSGGTLTAPVLTRVGLLVGSSVGTLWLVDELSGLATWELDPGVMLNGVTATPTVAGDWVYAVSNAGRLYALRGRVEPKPLISSRYWVGPGSRR